MVMSPPMSAGKDSEEPEGYCLSVQSYCAPRVSQRSFLESMRWAVRGLWVVGERGGRGVVGGRVKKLALVAGVVVEEDAVSEDAVLVSEEAASEEAAEEEEGAGVGVG